MKGLFIPGITENMFRNSSLEGIETLMAEGEIHNINYSNWIPVTEKLPEDYQRVLITVVNYDGDKVVRVAVYYDLKKIFKVKENNESWKVGEEGLLAWRPLPEPYKTESEIN